MRDYVVTIFIFALVPLCLYRPWWGVITWYWFGLMNPHRLTWDFAYSMPFAVFIGGATLLGALFARDRKPIPWNRELVIVSVLMLYFTTTNLFAWAPDYAWPQWWKVFKVILMTFVATMFIYGKDRVRALMLTIALSIGFYGVKGVIHLARGGGQIEGPEGTFIAGNTFLGLALNMVIPVLFFVAREEQRPWLRRILYVAGAFSIVSVIFTFSRGAYVGLVAILPLVFLRSRKKVVAASILIPAVLVAPYVLPERVFNRIDETQNYEQNRSSNQRLMAWSVAWNLALDRPLTGAGFEFEYAPDDQRWLRYGSEKYAWSVMERSSAAHSIYFQVLGQHGFIAFFLFLALLLGTLWSLQRIKARAQRFGDRTWIASYASGIQAGLIGYLVAGAFLSSAYFDLAYLYFALAAILARELDLGLSVAVSSATERLGGAQSRLPRSQPNIAQ